MPRHASFVEGTGAARPPLSHHDVKVLKFAESSNFSSLKDRDAAIWMHFGMHSPNYFRHLEDALHHPDAGLHAPNLAASFDAQRRMRRDVG